MAKQKLNWLLILQGWAMLWVVIGHSPLKMDETMPIFAKRLFDIAYSFHMPLFILVSGYLFYRTRLSSRIDSCYNGFKWTYKNIIMDKLKRLGIPFVVFTIVAMIMKVLFPGDMARPASFTVSEFIHAVLYPSEGPLLEMWFVAVIMWMFVLTPLWELCLKSKFASIFVLVLLFLLQLNVDKLPIGTFLCLRDTARFGVYFYLGMLASKYAIVDKCEIYKYRIMTLSFVLYLCFQYIGFRFGVAMSAIAFSIVIALLLDRYAHKIFSSFRDYTYQIFLMSIFAQIAVKMIYKRVALMDIAVSYPMLVYVVFFVVCLFMGLYIPVLVSKISERLNYLPILLTLGLKKK